MVKKLQIRILGAPIILRLIRARVCCGRRAAAIGAAADLVVETLNAAVSGVSKTALFAMLYGPTHNDSSRMCFPVIALLLLLPATYAYAQDSQFIFDPNGNLFVQKAATATPPQILGQPQNRIVAPDEAASFFVVALDTWAPTSE
jgi:hypothetical protein